MQTAGRSIGWRAAVVLAIVEIGCTGAPDEIAQEMGVASAAVPEADVHGNGDAPPGARSESVAVRLLEWRIELSRDTVQAGTTSFEIVNTGTHPHEFEIAGPGVDREVHVQPGRRTRLQVDLAAGSYEIVCRIRSDGIDHEREGMRTVLVVR